MPNAALTARSRFVSSRHHAKRNGTTTAAVLLMFAVQRLPFVLGSLCFAASVVGADFALRDGDTVAFLGDSITAARGYTKIVEHYTLMRYPQRRVRFVNAGKGGDTAPQWLPSRWG